MRLIIAGSRNIPDSESARLLLIWETWIKTATVVLSGLARGPDIEGRKFARMRGIPVEEHPALWQAEGRAAGMSRNLRMLERADALLAIWDGQSAGTKHIIQEASRRGLTVVVLGPGADQWNTPQAGSTESSSRSATDSDPH